jgi:hypothetical protein
LCASPAKAQTDCRAINDASNLAHRGTTMTDPIKPPAS